MDNLLKLFILASCLGCFSGCGQSLPAQKIEVSSGEFGVSELGTITSVDPVIVTDPPLRYGPGFGAAASAIVSTSADVSKAIFAEAAGLFGQATTEDLEEYIRSMSCVYTVSLDGSSIANAVYEEIVVGSVADDLSEEELKELMESPEFARLSGEERLNAIDELRQREKADRAQAASDDTPSTSEVSIVSNCILNVKLGSKVRIVKLSEKILILPQ